MRVYQFIMHPSVYWVIQLQCYAEQATEWSPPNQPCWSAEARNDMNKSFKININTQILQYLVCS